MKTPFNTRFVLLLLIVSLISSCAFIRPTQTPIASQYFHHDDASKTLVILLPGFGELPSQFVKYGTVDQLLSCQPNVNILGVDSHFGYYRKTILVETLRSDIIKPALDSGIEKIWLMGISMGGLGSLIYRQEYPDDIHATILMAPYVGGWEDLSLYIDDPEYAAETVNPKIIRLWNNLTSTAKQKPSITLAYGASDKMSRQHEWLAEQIGNNHSVSAAGKHKWTIWQKLWPEALSLSGFCGPG